MGADGLFVSRQLGHSKIGTTYVLYGHLLHNPEKQREILDAIFPTPKRYAEQAEQKEGPGRE